MKTIIYLSILFLLSSKIYAQETSEPITWTLKVEAWKDHENNDTVSCKIIYQEHEFEVPIELDTLQSTKIELEIVLTAVKEKDIVYRHTFKLNKLGSKPIKHNSKYIARAYCNQTTASGREDFIEKYIQNRYSLIKFSKIEK